MNMGNRSLIEFLQDIQNLGDFKKEFIINIENEKKFLEVNYKFYPFPRDVFSIFFSDAQEFYKCQKRLKKWKMYELVISETHWITSNGELKSITGEKKFIKCQLIDIRRDFLKVKIIP
jgi:hypothetical protein